MVYEVLASVKYTRESKKLKAILVFLESGVTSAGNIAESRLI
jgi:hypothetical protein